MIKNLLGLMLVLFVFIRCNSEVKKSKNTTIEKGIEEQPVLNEIDSSVEVSEELFDMHPEIDYYITDENEDILLSNLTYYTGEIGDNPIAIIINSENKGVYIYQESGKVFDVIFNYDGDSILIKRIKDGSTEKFNCSFNTALDKYTGYWRKDGDSLLFSMEVSYVETEKSQVFIKLCSENLMLIDGEIVIQTPISTEFNTFYIRTNIGEGFDTGQEWELNDQQMFYDDSTIVFVNCKLVNTESNSSDGTELSMDGSIAYKTITKGIITENEIKLNETSTYTPWLFKEYIILKNDEDESYISYKYDKLTKTYNLVNE